MMAENSCVDCVNFQERHRNIDGEGVERVEGLCRLNPPTPVFPVVQVDDYCVTGFTLRT